MRWTLNDLNRQDLKCPNCGTSLIIAEDFLTATFRFWCVSCDAGVVLTWDKLFQSRHVGDIKSQIDAAFFVRKGGDNMVKIWWDADMQAYSVTSPYNKGFVELLKQIPASDRAYNDQTKTWHFSEKYLDFVKKAVDMAWPGSSPSVITKDQTRAKTTSSSGTHRAPLAADIDTALAEFMKTLPYEAAAKAYKHAALLLHPDRGGDMEKMAKLNSLWTRIQTEVYKQ